MLARLSGNADKGYVLLSAWRHICSLTWLPLNFALSSRVSYTLPTGVTCRQLAYKFSVRKLTLGIQRRSGFGVPSSAARLLGSYFGG